MINETFLRSLYSRVFILENKITKKIADFDSETTKKHYAEIMDMLYSRKKSLDSIITQYIKIHGGESSDT